jgi:DNA replication protein DnaC
VKRPTRREQRRECQDRLVKDRSDVIALGNSWAGKTHIALGLGLAACQKGIPVGFTTAAALVNELHEARDEKAFAAPPTPARRLQAADLPPCRYPSNELGSVGKEGRHETSAI